MKNTSANYSLEALRHRRGGLTIKTGVVGGVTVNKAKTADKAHDEMLDYLRG